MGAEVTEPRSLTEVRTAPVPEAIAALEELLARAKTGELRTFLFCGITIDGGVIRARSTTEGNAFTLLGAWEMTRAMCVRWLAEE